MLLARGAGADRARAGALLARADGICRELDLPGIADRVAALTAQAPRPGRPVPPGNLPAPCSGAKVTTGRSPTDQDDRQARPGPRPAPHRLTASIHTGRFCSYAPPGETPPAWSL
jgi:hypothetical protein